MDRMMVEAVRRGGVASASPIPRRVHGLHRDAGNLAKHKVPMAIRRHRSRYS
jgi:hypothetical protein